MRNLIFSRRDDNHVMTNLEIEHRAPSVFAIDKSPTLSEKYGQITTAKAIDVMIDHGFFPTQAAQIGRGLHARHMLAFSAPIKPQDGQEGRPELILYNSHDGTSSLRMFAGFYRFVCSNGIIAGNGFEARLRHNTANVMQFENLVDQTAQAMPLLFDKIEEMRSTTLSVADTLEFVKTAAGYRWDQELITDATLQDIITPRRAGDAGFQKWTVFNRAQEALIRGGVRVGPNDRKARPLGSIVKTLEVNTKLWEIV